MQTLKTWKEKSTFSYTGCVKQGTKIVYGRKSPPKFISATQYAKLLNHFRGHIVDIGTSRDNRPPGSVGEWLQQSKVTKIAIASYVGPILIAERYAEKAGGSKIRFL